MWQIFIGSLILSIIHTSIPNHWIPVIAIGKTEKWSHRETLFATLITGFSHTFSTVIIGIIVGFIGYKLSAKYTLISNIIAPSILIAIGIIYLIIDYKNNRVHHHSHEHSHFDTNLKINKSKMPVLVSLSISMFLTPCTEIETYYFKAGTIGWTGIFTVSAVYIFTTVILMLILVSLGLKGIEKFKSHYLEHHDKQITGVVLVLLGISAFIISY